MLRRLDGHAAAVPSAFFASGADGVLRAGLQRIPPGMLVRAEVDGIVLFGDLVVRFFRVRGEDRSVVGLLIRRVGGDFDRAAGIGPVLCADADVCVRIQTVRADGNGFAAVQIEVFGLTPAALFIHAACAVQRALLPVIRDLYAAGNGHRAAAGQFHAAAPDGVVAGDAAAAHGEAAVIEHKHAATAAPVGAFVCGGVAGDAAAAHGKAAVVRIHAAAVAVGGIAGDDRAAAHVERALVETHAAAVFAGAIAGDLAAGHGERAVLDIHTTAVFGGIGVSSRAAADGAALHGEGRTDVFRIHAPAVLGGAVAGNGAAVHRECAAVMHIYATAIFVRAVAGDGAVLHGEGAGIADIYAAAVVTGAVAGDNGITAHGDAAAAHKHTAAGRGSAVAGDGSVVTHGECAVTAEIHTTTVLGGVAGDGCVAAHVECAAVADKYAASAAIAGGCSGVAGDPAAVHVECTGACIAAVHPHAAAAAKTAAADGAAVHVECAAGHFNAATSHIGCAEDDAFDGDLSTGVLYPPAGVIFLKCMRSFAAFAVGQGEGNVLFDGDDRIILCRIRTLDAVAVQTKVHAIGEFPSAAGLNIFGQVVAARLRDIA